MGQYHMLVNLDKREFIYSHQLGDGLKAWEQFANSPGGVASAAIYLQVAPTPRGGGDFEAGPYMGRWHGDRVVWVGDYAESDDFDPVTYVGTGQRTVTVSADMVYALCFTSPDDMASLISWAEEILEDDQRPPTTRDAARTLLFAIEAGIWFTNITPQVREAMAGELNWMEYYETDYGTIARREKPKDGSLTDAMERQGLKPDMILGGE